MAVYFLDSSAIAKRYVAETGSAWITDMMNPSAAHQLHLARISGVEVVAAFARRIRTGNLDEQAGLAAAMQFRADFEVLYRVVEISAPLVSRAMDLAEKHALRGYDAVQLAAALAVQDAANDVGLSTSLVSADDGLNAAASAEGLQVDNPNLHL